MQIINKTLSTIDRYFDILEQKYFNRKDNKCNDKQLLLPHSEPQTETQSEQASAQTSLSSLSDDEICYICAFLPDKDKIALLSTCRRFRQLINNIYLTSKYNQQKVMNTRYYSRMTWLENIHSLILPDCLLNAEFSLWFNQPIGSLPRNLQSAMFGFKFKQNLQNKLPPALKTLYLECDYKYPINEQTLPRSIEFASLKCESLSLNGFNNLTELVLYDFKGQFTQPLPKSIKKLKLDYKYPLKVGDLPECLEHLILFKYTHALNKYVLPETLITLYLGCSDFASNLNIVGQNIHEGVLPSQLKYLSVSGWIFKCKLPANVYQLELFNYSESLTMLNDNIEVVKLYHCSSNICNFPNNIKSMDVIAYTGESIKLPDNLEHLRISTSNKLDSDFMPSSLLTFVLINYTFIVDFQINENLQSIEFINVKTQYIGDFMEKIKSTNNKLSITYM